MDLINYLKDQTTGDSNATAQKIDDSNNDENLTTSSDDAEVPTLQKKLPAKKLEPAGQTNTQTNEPASVKENESTIEKPKLPSYKVNVFTAGDGIKGQVFADGELIDEVSYYYGFSQTFTDQTGKTTTTVGEAAVKENLIYKLTNMGYYSPTKGKFYPESPNVS